MVGGEPREVDVRLAARFEVVRGILVGTMTLRQGARRLRMELEALAMLVEGARQRVLAALAIPNEVEELSSRYVDSRGHASPGPG
jgi:hypothetical protein